MVIEKSVLAVLLAAGFAVGCGSLDDSPEVEPELSGTVGEQLDETLVETGMAARAIHDFAFAQRASFIEQMELELGGIQVELDRLSGDVERTGGVTRTSAQAKLEAVRGRLAVARRRLHAVESASASDWDDVMAGFKQSYGELRNSFELVRQWLSIADES